MLEFFLAHKTTTTTESNGGIASTTQSQYTYTYFKEDEKSQRDCMSCSPRHHVDGHTFHIACSSARSTQTLIRC